MRSHVMSLVLCLASMSVWGQTALPDPPTGCPARVPGQTYLCISGTYGAIQTVAGAPYVPLIGPAGPAATIKIGTVISGTQASVIDTGTPSAAVLNFVLPVGPAGPVGPSGSTGSSGPQGPPGPAGTMPAVFCATITANTAGKLVITVVPCI